MTEVMNGVTRGNLSLSFKSDMCGEIRVLKDAIKTMQSQIYRFTSEMSCFVLEFGCSELGTQANIVSIP